MASILTSDLTALINSVPVTDLVAQYARDNTFLKYLGSLQPDERGTWDFGVVTGANTSRGVAAETTTLTTAGQTSKNKLRYDQKIFFTTFGVSGLSQAKAQGGGYSYSNNLIADELAQSVEEMFDQINDTMLSGSYASAGAYGINNLIDNSGSFAGATRGTNTWADAKIVSKAGTGLITGSVADLETIHTELVDTRRANYTELWTSENVLKQYETYLRSIGTYTLRPDVLGDSSFQYLSFKGRRMIAIPGYQNRIDFVDPRNFWFQFLPTAVVDTFGQRVEGPFKVMEMGKTADQDVFNLILYGSFINRSPWKCGAVTNIKTF